MNSIQSAVTKLQEIENKLLSINDAVFQNVCDAFLYFTENAYPDINRSGSQRGKQKTIKGTPDTYFQLPSGLYVLVEYTTKDKSQNKEKFFEKIKDDIDKCLNPEITGINLNSIEKIIYCCNTSLSISEDNELKSHCLKKGIRLELKTINVLAFGLLGRCAHVAKEFLGIAIDTAQILPPEKFIEEYEASGYTTKLNNQFLSREKELEHLKTTVESNKVIIINGAPGVGKTKLVLTMFTTYKKENKNYIPYVISNKTAPIYDDLRTYIKEDKNYIILIDDANRQVSNLASTLSLLTEKRKGLLRIIITVRDYAYNDILNQCDIYNPTTFTLNKLTDDQIKAILQSGDFQINNPEYVDRILAIADGNPRLAVMAATVALQKQDLMALVDVSDLYDRYFRNTVDRSIFADANLLKVLGVVSFFYSIEKTDTEFCHKLYTNFGIIQYIFIESIEKLERLELLESSKDLTIIRISEQVLGTYFFYKVFFKEQLLDFSIVLSHYFDTHSYRLIDTVVPANNTFGYDNVYKKIDPFLTHFWTSIKHDKAKAFQFLDLFWFYKTDEALGFVYDEIKSLSDAKDHPVFTYFEKTGYQPESEKDKYLPLLSKFYYYPLDCLESALELGATYVRKKPETYTEYCKNLKDAFIFRFEDERYRFYRQDTVCTFLCSHDPVDELSASLFYEVMIALMKTSYNVTSGGRKRNSISFYKYDVPLMEPVKKFRRQVWSYLLQNFQLHKEKAEGFMYAYLERTPNKAKLIFTFDLPFILRIIKQHLRKSSFVHCYLVQDFIYRLSRLDIKDPSFQKLKIHFQNEVYKVYTKLVHDRLNARFEHDLKFNFEEYNRRKDIEIRQSFQFKTLKDFRKFYETFKYLSDWGTKHNINFNRSFDLLLDENAKRSPALAIKMLQEIITYGNNTNHIPWLAFLELSKSQKAYHKLYNIIQKNTFRSKHHWLLNWLTILPEEQITNEFAVAILGVFQTVDQDIFIDLSCYEKYLQHDSRLFHKVLEVLEKRNNECKIRLTLD